MTTTQDRAIRHILAQLEMISHGSITAYNSAGGNDSEHPGGKRPAGDSCPPHDRYREQYVAAKTDSARSAVIDAAQCELRALRKAAAPSKPIEPETEAEFDARAQQLLAHGWEVEDVARAMKCTPTRIRRAATACKHPDVHALAAEGKSVRGISISTGLSKSEIHRILKRAA